MIITFMRLLLFFGVTTAFSLSGSAAVIASCNANFTLCAIPENILLTLPFTGIAGDVIVEEPTSTAVSDVFRLFNNVIDTGGGTGLGDQVFLYSVDDGPLPPLTSYSLNALTIHEVATGLTSFNGNGTLYVLDTPEPFSSGLAAFGIGAIFFLSRRWLRSIWATILNCLVGLLFFGCFTTFAQNDPAAVDPLPPSSGIYRNMMGLGPVQPNQAVTLSVTSAATGLTFFTGRYESLGTGRLLPFNIIGTNPANGSATTIVPTVIIPIRVVYQTAGGLFLDGANITPAVQNSPIFQATDYTVGQTEIGSTQFGDALQRAQFWQFPGFSPDYHVLLGAPTVASTVWMTVNTPSQGNLYRLRSGGLIGVVASSFLDGQLNQLIAGYNARTLLIFVTDNVFEGSDGTIGTCCIIGYHSSQGPPASSAQTWIYAAYAEPGTFTSDAIIDVQTLSHEVAEWLNDPFVGAFSFGFLNVVPPAILPGQGSACILNFETGDPLESPPSVFTKIINGTTYHLQDEVFLTWYLHTTPSFSVNGWYTMQNTLSTFSSLCGPG